MSKSAAFDSKTKLIYTQIMEEKKHISLTEKSEASEHHQGVHKKLPALSDLFETSWELYKKTFLAYLKLVGIGWGFYAGGVIIIFLLTIPLMITSGGSAENLFQNPSALQIILMILVVVLVITFLIAFIGFAILVSIAYVFVLDKESMSLKELFQRSKPFVLPFMVVSFLEGFIAVGGSVLFMLPGLLFYILFVFTVYGMVLENLRGRAALERSYLLVTSHFWEITGRILLVQGAFMVLSYVIDNSAQDAPLLLTILSFVFSILVGWFVQAYIFSLYKQVRAGTSVAKTVSIRWVWIVAIVGWVLFIWLIITLANSIPHMQELQDIILEASTQSV